MKDYLITIITWNRLNLTKHTLRTFWNLNGKDHPILVVDNGSSDGTVKWLKKHNIEVIQNRKNQGIYVATRKAWMLAKDRGYEFILNLQNDFPSIRKIPFDDIISYMRQKANVGFVRLNDKSRMLVIHRDGSYKIKNRKRTRNFITRKKFKFGPYEIFGNLKIRTTNHHFSFNPNFFRSSLVDHFVSSLENPRERHIMEQFERLGMKSAKPISPYFETVLRPRQKHWQR